MTVTRQGVFPSKVVEALIQWLALSLRLLRRHGRPGTTSRAASRVVAGLTRAESCRSSSTSHASTWSLVEMAVSLRRSWTVDGRCEGIDESESNESNGGGLSVAPIMKVPRSSRLWSDTDSDDFDEVAPTAQSGALSVTWAMAALEQRMAESGPGGAVWSSGFAWRACICPTRRRRR